jgi:hypothetical protein
MRPFFQAFKEQAAVEPGKDMNGHAGSDEAGHAFQFEAGRGFRFEAGHPGVARMGRG